MNKRKAVIEVSDDDDDEKSRATKHVHRETAPHSSSSSTTASSSVASVASASSALSSSTTVLLIATTSVSSISRIAADASSNTEAKLGASFQESQFLRDIKTHVLHYIENEDISELSEKVLYANLSRHIDPNDYKQHKKVCVSQIVNWFGY